MVQFPSEESVKLIGNLNRAELTGVGVSLGFGVVAVMGNDLVLAVIGAALVLAWTFAPNRRKPLRSTVPAYLRWLLKRNRRLATNVTGKVRAPAFLGRVDVHLFPTATTPVGVVQNRTRFTVAWLATRRSLAFSSESEVEEAIGSWGEVISQMCVESGAEMVPARMGWIDIHHAADPQALERQHTRRGVPGPASEDYRRHITGFDRQATGHTVVVWIEVSVQSTLRVAKRTGLKGSRDEIMIAAAAEVARGVRADMVQRGFTCGQLMTPAEVGRILTGALDPFAPTRDTSQMERFGLAERIEPESTVEVTRSHVAIDRSLHRVFRLQAPAVAQPIGWMWRILGQVNGPKLVSVMFEGLAPSRADRERDSRRAVGVNNNRAMASGQNHVSVKNQRKVEALAEAERSVADGHQEAEAYVLVVLSATSLDDLESKCRELRQAARTAGKANVIEFSGLHDEALKAALPIGHFVATDRS